MSFRDRLDEALEFEQRVIDGLIARGWLAHPFGQGQIPSVAREALQRYVDPARRPSLLRWMPDIIALRGPELVLVDAKSTDGKRYAIETRAVEVAEVFVKELYTPVFFVCGQHGGVLTARDIRERGFAGPVNESTGGSRTPYMLVEKHWAARFDDVFGQAPVREAAA